jgi:adenine specific DNA methylase Mod
MPTLEWVGKKSVINHHRKVPYHLLRCESKLSVGDPDTGNLLVQGDNLVALKALLPHYAGKVKCIYIDPPYNTGNEKWVYNDNVNSPEICDWLQKTVGKEGEDLSRHDKWLCMMYPRLALLKQFLTKDGVIFISIDDDEGHYLKVLCDEIFGRKNFINTIIWQKKFSPQNDAKWLSDNHDFILGYAKDKDQWKPNLLPRSEIMDSRYKNPDNDSRGVWMSSDLTAQDPVEYGQYELTAPNGTIHLPGNNRHWIYSRDKMITFQKDNRIWFGKNGNNKPRLKKFLHETQQGMVSLTIWQHTEVGHTQDAKKEVIAIFGTENIFGTPKPERLIERILTLGSNTGDLVLDSFLGSGTTAAVAMKMGRRFIGIEMGEHCETHCYPRLKAVVEGEQGGISQSVNWNGGGGFRYFKLSGEFFDTNGMVSSEVHFGDMAAHVFFTETGSPLPKHTNSKTPFLGIFQNRAIYLLYNGILGDKHLNGGNVLTHKVVQNLPEYDGVKIVYGESCLLSKKSLERYSIVFRQIPFELKND